MPKEDSKNIIFGPGDNTASRNSIDQLTNTLSQNSTDEFGQISSPNMNAEVANSGQKTNQADALNSTQEDSLGLKDAFNQKIIQYNLLKANGADSEHEAISLYDELDEMRSKIFDLNEKGPEVVPDIPSLSLSPETLSAIVNRFEGHTETKADIKALSKLSEDQINSPLLDSSIKDKIISIRSNHFYRVFSEKLSNYTTLHQTFLRMKSANDSVFDYETALATLETDFTTLNDLKKKILPSALNASDESIPTPKDLTAPVFSEYLDNKIKELRSLMIEMEFDKVEALLRTQIFAKITNRPLNRNFLELETLSEKQVKSLEPFNSFFLQKIVPKALVEPHFTEFKLSSSHTEFKLFVGKLIPSIVSDGTHKLSLPIFYLFSCLYVNFSKFKSDDNDYKNSCSIVRLLEILSFDKVSRNIVSNCLSDSFNMKSFILLLTDLGTNYGSSVEDSATAKLIIDEYLLALDGSSSTAEKAKLLNLKDLSSSLKVLWRV